MGRIEYRALPVPAFPEYTVRIAAGAVTFGVEYRHLDEATILAQYGPDSRALFDGTRLAERAMILGEPVWTDDLAEIGPLSAEASRTGLRAAAAVPVRDEG